MRLKKIIGTIHLWLGLATGLVVFIMGLTGCIMAFEEEIKSVVYAHKLKVDIPENAQVLPMSQLLEIAQEALGNDVPVQRVHIENQPN
ncbi:MAG: PepSY-associated TM helix domain-containing protein, partial [Bacteroidota bacterium]